MNKQTLIHILLFNLLYVQYSSLISFESADAGRFMGDKIAMNEYLDFIICFMSIRISHTFLPKGLLLAGSNEGYYAILVPLLRLA